MGKLYTLLTDRNGHYAVKLDNEFLYRTDDSIHGDRYCYVVDNFKSAKELKTDQDFEAFVGSLTSSAGERPKYIEG